MKILLACDRSAGHIFPACTIAYYAKKHYDVYIFVTSKYFKHQLKGKGFKVVGREFPKRLFFLEIPYRIGEALALILKLRPKRIIGFGGRGSFFLVLLGRIFFLDTSIYEPNFRFGKANRILSFFVSRIYSAWHPHLKFRRAKKIGIPIAPHIRRYDKREARAILGIDPWCVCVFCFGGSQGSNFVNFVFKKVIEELKKPIGVIHLTGPKDYYILKDFYDKIVKTNFFIKDFFYDIGLLYSAADFVICRGGALSIAEVSYFLLPAIFIPLPAAGNHQLDNVKHFVEKGCGYLVEQDKDAVSKIKKIFLQLLQSQELREKIKENIRRFRIYSHGEDFCNHILDISSSV